MWKIYDSIIYSLLSLLEIVTKSYCNSNSNLVIKVIVIDGRVIVYTVNRGYFVTPGAIFHPLGKLIKSSGFQ